MSSLRALLISCTSHAVIFFFFFFFYYYLLLLAGIRRVVPPNTSHFVHFSCRDFLILFFFLITYYFWQESDVSSLRALLISCSSKLDRTVSKDCTSRCSQIPRDCLKHKAVITILHYLADINFLPPPQPKVSQVILLLSFFIFGGGT